jgi:ankyrin repeat protein
MDNTLSLVAYLMGTSGFLDQADRITRLSSDILRNKQALEGIARYKSSTGRTLLMHAVKKRDFERVKLLVELGADIHARDKDGNAALDYAIRCGHLEIFQFLCDKGVALDTSNKIGFTPLHYTSMLDHPDMTAILIEKGVSLDTECIHTPLMDACENGRDKIVRLLCEAGASLDSVGYRGATALHYATARGSSEIVQLLCDKDAILDQENHDRETPLDLACMNGHLNVVRILLAAGAVLDQSHLYTAVHRGHMNPAP